MRKKNKIKLSPKTLRFRRNFCILSFLIIILLIGISLSLTILFKIENIEVNGYTKYSNEEIVSSSLIVDGSNLFMLNTKKVSDAIKKALPYIDDAKIIKKIPNSVIIKVSQTKPTYAFQIEESYLLINEKEKILDVVSDIQDRSLCIVKGVDIGTFQPGENIIFEDKETGNALRTIINAISAYKMMVNEVDLSDFSKISFVYENRIKVNLGISEKLDYKLKTASHILKEKIENSERGTLDLSLILDNEHSYFTPE